MKKAFVLGLAVVMALGICGLGWCSGAKVPQILYENYKAGKPIPLPSKHVAGLTVDGAYEIQGLYVASHLKAGEQVSGFKAGLTSAPAQKKFKAPGPASGVLLKSMQITNGVVDTKLFTRTMLEVEIGFILGKDVNGPVTPEQAKAAAASALPAVEVPDLNFETFKGLGFADIVAANVGARAYILGKPVPLGGVDVNKATGQLLMNGKALGPAVPGKAALGDQWKALAWVLNNALKTGGAPKKGMVVITGSLGRMYPGKPGQYKAVYTGGLGEISFTVK